MKNKLWMCICLMMLMGCSQEVSSQVTNTKPILELLPRIQVELNKTFDYKQCIKEASDKEDGSLLEQVKVSDVDTSKVGTQTVHFEVTDSAGEAVSQDMKVDVVHFYENGVYNPMDVQPDTVKDPTDITVLVNKVNQIPEGYVPDDLVAVIDNPQQKLRKEANDAYTKFYQEAQKKGIELHSISGYRTNDTQTLYWNNQVKVFGEAYASLYSAYPGRSEHQLGLAIDVSYKTTGDRLSESVATSDIGKFIVSDAYKYGFILRYPKDKVSITNYAYEPWHIRYVGIELATKLHTQNITLEEYYQ